MFCIPGVQSGYIHMLEIRRSLLQPFLLAFLLLFEAHETLDLQFCWFYPLGKNTAFAKTIPSNTFVCKTALRLTQFVGKTSHFDD
jgi:hypothetical protein